MHKKTTEMVAVSQLFRNFAPTNFNKTIKEEWLI